jgi:hypothetical protein
MKTPFLENKAHTFTIAKIAIVFQSTLTVLISSSLLTILTRATFPLDLLKWLVYCDGMFVVAHLSYRAAYRGPNVALQRSEKKILVLHSMSSLLALCMTGFMVKQGSQVGFYYIVVLLSIWVISLVSGVIFFKRKYLK